MDNEQGIEKFYDKYLMAKSYPYEEYRHKNIDDFILSAVKPSDKVLDLACGTGRILKKFKNKQLFGCDISRKALTKVPKNVKTKHANLEKKLPYKDNEFDCIILREVLEHIINRKLLFSEIYRIMKKDGRLIITTPNKYSTIYIPYAILSRIAMQPVEEWLSHGQIEKSLKESGFAVERFETIHFFPWHSYLPEFFLPVVKKIDSWSRNNRWNRNLFFVAKIGRLNSKGGNLQ